MMKRTLRAKTISLTLKNLVSLFALLCSGVLLQAQTISTVGPQVGTNSTAGPTTSTTTGARIERHTAIYSATELTTAGLSTNDAIMSIAWEKTGFGYYYEPNLTIRVWLKHNAATTFPANPTFATETGSATLVYETTTGSLPFDPGWVTFPFNMVPSFTWNGSNLQVITEIIRPASWYNTGFLWRTTTSVTNAGANGSGTTAPATLTRTGTRPQIRLSRSTIGLDAAIVAIPSPTNGPAGTQNVSVRLQNTGTVTLTTATLSFTVNAGAPVSTPWAGSLAPGADATVVINTHSFGNGTNVIVGTVSDVNGGADVDPANNSFTKNIETCSPLSGSYTIDQTAPASASNFTSFTSFASSLRNCGVGGHVTATVVASSGPYAEQVEFSHITGLSASATVTIQGNGEAISTPAPITITNTNPERHVIRLRELSYFTINNLHVNMFSGSTGFMGVSILTSGHHISITNCEFDMSPGTSTLMGAMVATALPSSILEEGNFTDLTFSGNTTIAGGYGVAVNGLTAGSATGIVISDNTITGTTSNGIYLQNTNGVIVSGNTVNFSSSNGIQLAQAGNINGTIIGNFVSCTNPTVTTTLRGIYVFGSTPGTPNKVINNVVKDMNAPNATVVGLANRTTGAEFYFNTVILDQTAATGNLSFGYEEDLSTLNAILRNNIFYITRGAGNYAAALAFTGNTDVATDVTSNNNVFYIANGVELAVQKGTLVSNPPADIYSNLSDWQLASGEDANSFQTDPQFQAGTAIPTSGVINGQGVAITGITTDILGVTRGTPPDPGAYEFAPPAGDAAITDFILPVKPHCANTLDVQFELTNAGSDPLNSVTINWSVNGVPQPTVSWAGPTLASGASTFVTLGTVPVTGNNSYDFSATSSNPNGFPDVNPANDTWTYTGFRRGLEGTITINKLAPVSATNFQTFQSAADALSLHGVCSAVLIDVLNGPYTEQAVFNTIPGTSSVNTVTLDGGGQLLQFNPTVSNADHILQLNAVEHMIVEDLVVTSLHATQGRGIHITNGASKLTIRDNTVNVSTTNNASTTFGIIISGENWLLDGSLSDSVVITGNTVTGGYSSIQLSGEHWTQPLTRMVVEDNTVLDWYGFGVYLSYTNNAIVRSNIIRRPTRTNSGSDAVTPAAITIPAGSNGFMLDKNRIYDLHVAMPGSPTISRGVYLSGTAIAPTSGTIQNNLIYGMRNDGAQYGIQDNSVNGPINIYHNTIVLDGPTGASTSNTNAINLSNFSPQFNTNIHNNIFVVTRGGTGVKRIFDVGDNGSVFFSDHNVAYLNTTGGTQTFGQVGTTNYLTLADWQTGTGKDAASVAEDPLFTNPGTGDYTPTNFLIDGTTMNTSSVGVLDDILGVIRSSNPDPGAFEFSPPPCTGAIGGTATAQDNFLCTAGSTTLEATGFSTGLGTSYQWEFSNDNFVSDIHDLAGETNPLSASTGVIGSTTWFRLRVECSNGPVVGYSNIVEVTVGTLITTQPQDQTLCAGGNATFTVVVTGSGISYQWRKNTINISGATSSSYTITGVTPADAGDYDVVITSACGNAVSATAELKVFAQGSWTGLVNSDWNNAGNWCGGIPTPTTDVVIPAQAPNMPILTFDVGSARNVTIDANATLTVGDVGMLNLYGDLVNNGTLNSVDGHLVFRGANPQHMPTFEAENVTMNGAGGLILGGHAKVNGGMIFQGGHINLGPYNLTIGAGGNGSLASHVITDGTGNVILDNFSAGNSRIIPIGPDAATYNPVIIVANPGHITDNFVINVKPGAYVNGVSGIPYIAYVVDRTWNISEMTEGGSSVNITVQWAPAQELQNFDRSKSYIAQYNGTDWVHGIPTSAAGTNPYLQTKFGVTSFSPFIVRNEPIPRPITGIYPNPTQGLLFVVLENIQETPAIFRVFDASGRLVKEDRYLIPAGVTRTTLDMDKLPSGNYLLRVSTPFNANFLVQKFIKLR